MADDDGEGQDFQSLTTDLQPFVCSHALMRFGSVGYNSPHGFRWDFAYVYDKVKSAGETRLKCKLLKVLKGLCNDVEPPLPASHLHLQAGRRQSGSKKNCSKCDSFE